MTSFMIDVEALSIRVGAMTMCGAIMAFDLKDLVQSRKLEVKAYKEFTLNVREYDETGKAVYDPRTIGWWMTQPDDSRLRMAKILMDECDETNEDILLDINSFVLEQNFTEDESRFWCRGPDYDFTSALGPMYNSIGCKPPWQYFEMMDVRTITTTYKDIFGVALPKDETKHTPLQDCCDQLRQLVRLLSGEHQLDWPAQQ